MTDDASRNRPAQRQADRLSRRGKACGGDIRAVKEMRAAAAIARLLTIAVPQADQVGAQGRQGDPDPARPYVSADRVQRRAPRQRPPRCWDSARRCRDRRMAPSQIKPAHAPLRESNSVGLQGCSSLVMCPIERRAGDPTCWKPRLRTGRPHSPAPPWGNRQEGPTWLDIAAVSSPAERCDASET